MARKKYMAQKDGVFEEDTAESGVSPVHGAKTMIDQAHRNENVEHVARSAILVESDL